MNSLLPATFFPRGLSRPLRVRIPHFLLLGWPAYAIVAECHAHPATIYRMARNLLQYGGMRAPAVRKLGRPRRLTTADEDAVLEMRKAYVQCAGGARYPLFRTIFAYFEVR
jgi:hypothetical protein